MSVELSNYYYSHPNAIGSTLKQPLFRLISNVAISLDPKPDENQALRIAKVAFNCLMALIFIIPAGLAWFAGKVVAHFSKTQIDHDLLSLAPPPVQIPEEVELDKSIDILEISRKFKALRIKNKRLSSQTSIEKCLFQLCHWTATKNVNIYSDDENKRELFCKQLSNLLKGIIKRLDSGEISKDKEEDILIELAKASTRCYPTWLEAAAKLFDEIHGQPETVEVKLLRIIQDYKENLVLTFCQQEVNAQWHALNYVRNILGLELGLNTSLNEQDPYAAHDNLAFSKDLAKWLFLQRYENVNQLISAVQTQINFRKYDQSYYDFILEINKQQGIQNPIKYVEEHFFTEDYKLNELGANLMLRAIGILK